MAVPYTTPKKTTRANNTRPLTIRISLSILSCCISTIEILASRKISPSTGTFQKWCYEIWVA